MDGWVERESAWSLFSFACVQKFAARRVSRPPSLPLYVSPTSPSVYPSLPLCLGVTTMAWKKKHLQLPGNYGLSQNSGQCRADELRHPAISPASPPPLALSLPWWPAYYLSEETPGEGKKTDEWSLRDTSGGRWGHQHCPPFGFLWIVLVSCKLIPILLLFNLFTDVWDLEVLWHTGSKSNHTGERDTYRKSLSKKKKGLRSICLLPAEFNLIDL